MNIKDAPERVWICKYIPQATATITDGIRYVVSTREPMSKLTDIKYIRCDIHDDLKKKLKATVIEFGRQEKENVKLRKRIGSLNSKLAESIRLRKVGESPDRSIIAPEFDITTHGEYTKEQRARDK